MKIHYLPLELIEGRYTRMMNEALRPLVDTFLYPGEYINQRIFQGEFLDVMQTNLFKSQQLGMIVDLFQKKQVKDGDWFLVGDMFFPGITMIKYMSELQGINVRLAGFNYAGRADPTDFVQMLGNWSDKWEEGVHEMFDRVFVGSQFHYNQVRDKFPQATKHKVLITGYVWSIDHALSVYQPTDDRIEYNSVIWPHRPCKEKGFDELLEIARLCPDYKFRITSSGPARLLPEDIPSNISYHPNLTKEEYYKMMARSEIYLSCAHQETFGYTLQEAIVYNCKILVPNRACYPEFVPFTAMYSTPHEAAQRINKDALPFLPPSRTRTWDKNAERIIRIIRDS